MTGTCYAFRWNSFPFIGSLLIPNFVELLTHCYSPRSLMVSFGMPPSRNGIFEETQWSRDTPGYNDKSPIGKIYNKSANMRGQHKRHSLANILSTLPAAKKRLIHIETIPFKKCVRESG